MKQTPISMYFRCSSTSTKQSKKTTDISTSTAKRKLSLNESSSKTPAKIKCDSLPQLITKPIEYVSLLSSSDDETIAETSKTEKNGNVNKSNVTNSDSDTDEYSWTMDSNPPTPEKATPRKQFPRLSVTPTTVFELSTNEPKTPQFMSPKNLSPPNITISILQSPKALQNKNNENSPNKSNKYYSASKKRSVTKIQQKYTPSPQSLDGTVRKLFGGTNEKKYIDSENLELDDKTYFFVKIAKTFLNDISIHYLLSESELNILTRFTNLNKVQTFMLICRMYWRKHKWYTAAACHKTCNTLASELLNELVSEEILLKESGSDEEMSLDDYINDVLMTEDLQKLCKFFKLKKENKKPSATLLRRFCSRTSTILQCFRHGGGTVPATPGQEGNSKRVLKKMAEIAGTCYKLSEQFKNTFYKVILISHLGINFEVIRENRLELLLLQVKNGQETFPIESCEIDSANCVFPSKLSFDNYMTAHYLYEKFLSLAPTKSGERKAIVWDAYLKYKSICNEVDIHTKSPWLRKYTAQNLYIKIVEQGIMELKKGKDEVLCESAAEMMATLLQQGSHRSHRRAVWADEHAKILHKYLRRPAQAAEILLEALESDIPDESKDILRRRAQTIACQKNIRLEETVRNRLLTVTEKGCVSEKNLPYSNFYQQPMENVKKGKVQYKIKGNNGYEVLCVEDVAIDIYKSFGEFTEGYHWEGKMINTQFYLLFWDIIYKKPKNTLGIFLCPYQMSPLDLYMSTFYSNRRKEIDERINLLEHESTNNIILQMEKVWKARPKGELSGVQLSLQWKHIHEVTMCMGARGVAAVCRRLARNYNYAHSGFPDLTVWNADTKKIKFVEVKSDSDKPSVKQLQWIQYLLENGLMAEFCHIGVERTPKPLPSEYSPTTTEI